MLIMQQEVDSIDTILAVHTDLKIHEVETAEWLKVGIEILRVDTMHDAIARLMRGGVYIFVVIIEDSIPDFFLRLSIMRDVTDLPIFVMTSSYSIEKKTKAIDLGADGYDPIGEHLESHVAAGLALLNGLSRRVSRNSDEKPPALLGGDIILSLARHIVLVNDAEVSLTKKEFDILHYLIHNRGCFLSADQLLKEVWGDEYSENGHNILWQVIKRIRHKLAEVSPNKKYIVVERDVGYKFIE